LLMANFLTEQPVLAKTTSNSAQVRLAGLFVPMIVGFCLAFIFCPPT